MNAEAILEELSESGAADAEVFVKEGRSIRISVTGGGPCHSAIVEERGMAVRAWDRDGRETFRSFVPPGRGDPDDPEDRGDPHAAGLGRAGEEAERFLAELHARFDRPGLAAVRLEQAWWESGVAAERLLTSRGLSIERASAGWHAAAQVSVEDRAGNRRSGWLGVGGRAGETVSPERFADEISWRASAPAGGGDAPLGAADVLVDEAIASRWLQAVAGLFVATESTVAALERRERVGPDGLTIVEEGPGDDDEDDACDGEGVPRRRVVLVEDGRRAGLLNDTASARRFGLDPTGSARRRSFRDRPAAGARALTLSLDGSRETRDDLLGRLGVGLFVTTGRLLATEAGGLALIGGGLRTAPGEAPSAVGRALVEVSPARVLSSLAAVSAPPRLSWADEASCGALLLRGASVF